MPRSPTSSAKRPPTRANAIAQEHEVGFMITRVRRKLWQAAAGRLEAAGEPIADWPILSHLAKSGPASQRDLANAIAQDPAGVCRLLETLETQGDVRRSRDTHDRRKVLVELTNKGRARFERMYPQVTAAIEELLAPLAAGERLQLGSLLRKMLDE